MIYFLVMLCDLHVVSFQDSYDFCDMSAKKHIRQITKRVIYPSEHIVPSVNYKNISHRVKR